MRGFDARFSRNPFIIRVPFFLLFGFKKETPKPKRQKGTTGEPSIGALCGFKAGSLPLTLNPKP